MMTVIKILIYLILIGYLLRQAAMDAKTGYVVKIYNDIALAVSFTGMVIDLYIKYGSSFFTEAAALFIREAFVVCLCLYLISSDRVPRFLKIMQKADAKAFATVYFSSFVLFSEGSSLKILCLSIFFANIFFMGWYHLINKEKVKMVSDVHKPYFPFILSGYIATTVLYLFVKLL